jgi:hypothetical protein
MQAFQEQLQTTLSQGETKSMLATLLFLQLLDERVADRYNNCVSVHLANLQVESACCFFFR